MYNITNKFFLLYKFFFLSQFMIIKIQNAIILRQEILQMSELV